jgi:hypothetical protein
MLWVAKNEGKNVAATIHSCAETRIGQNHIYIQRVCLTGSKYTHTLPEWNPKGILYRKHTHTHSRSEILYTYQRVYNIFGREIITHTVIYGVYIYSSGGPYQLTAGSNELPLVDRSLLTAARRVGLTLRASKFTI